jgi:hypothetical protein
LELIHQLFGGGINTPEEVLQLEGEENTRKAEKTICPLNKG